MPTRNTAPSCFPDRFALALLGLGLALYLGLGWLVLASNRNAAAFRDVVLVAEEALGRIRETVEGMRALTVLRLGTGEARYDVAFTERRQHLSAALATLRRLAPETDELYDLPAIEAHLNRIAGLEVQALALAGEAQSDRAWAAVSGPEYEAAEADLRACLDQCHDAINAGLERLLASQAGHARAGWLAIVVATPGLAVFFLLLLRRAVRATRDNAAAQAALAESERRFRATFEQAAVGIAHVGLDGSFLRVNARFAAITGYSVHELANLTFAAITHPEDLEADLGQVERLRAGGIRTYTRDKRYLRKDGQPVWASLTVSLLRDAAGAPLYYIAVIADISERKAAEAAARESAAAVTTLLDAASDRVIVADATGRILAVNAAAAAGLGLTPQTLVGLDFETVFPKELARSRLVRLRRALDTGRPVRFTDERDGIIYDHIIAPLPHAAGRPGRAALFARDATQFVRAREAAEAASRAKSDFLANVSHELRTPLNGILGMAQVLGVSSLDAEQRQCLDDIDSAAGALLTLVNDLLELSSLEAEGLELARQPVVLSSLLEGVTATLTPLAAAKGLTLATRLGPDAPRLIMGDGDRLRQVLATLVGNAVKFTETGGVTIEVDCAGTCGQTARTEQAGNAAAVTFAVRDTGIGIARQDQDRIFDSFTQADGSSTRRFGGAGLGLAICRRLVERMGGELTVASEPGQGSVFSFTLRLELPDEDVAASLLS